MTERLFHLALPDEWADAQPSGHYDRSTRGRSLDDEGFVHCSYRHQVTATANRFYADLPAVVVLTLDVARLGALVVAESAAPGGEVFPHVYGAIPVEAVSAAAVWKRGPDDVYVDPPIE